MARLTEAEQDLNQAVFILQAHVSVKRIEDYLQEDEGTSIRSDQADYSPRLGLFTEA